MSSFQAIILGIIQGLTEFLPISSSGHLVLFQHIFGLKEPELFFDICVHLGTLVAVIIFFRKDLITIITSLIHGSVKFIKKEASLSELFQKPDIKLAVLIVIGSVPTAILGLLFKKISDQLFSSLIIVGVMLIVTGIILWCTRWIKKNGRLIDGFSIKNSLVIGIIQGLAIIPGISRSGSTIAFGLFLGIERETAARFSFLLSIPAIFGATLLVFKDVPHGMGLPLSEAITGGLTACIVGYCSLKSLVYIVKKGQLHFFAPYCWIIGVLALIWSF